MIPLIFRLKTRRAALLTGLLWAIAALAGAESDLVVHVSPDGQLKAIITRPRNPLGAEEHRVEIRAVNGKRLALNDHTSADHAHGYGVLQAAWTPDSRFFVYSVSSSGGHGAWHFYTHAFVRDRSQFYCLDDLVGPFVTPKFRLLAPNRFQSKRLDPKGEDGAELRVNLALQDLPWSKRR